MSNFVTQAEFDKFKDEINQAINDLQVLQEAVSIITDEQFKNFEDKLKFLSEEIPKISEIIRKNIVAIDTIQEHKRSFKRLISDEKLRIRRGI